MENEDLEKLLPQINVNVPQQSPQEEKENMVPDELLMGLYSEVLDDIRKEREQIDGLIDNFVNMVINDGDSTTSSKEALVNLVKIKTDTSNSKTKVLDLMTRVKLKERDTFPRYLSANQNNKITITESSSKRELIKALSKKKKENSGS